MKKFLFFLVNLSLLPFAVLGIVLALTFFTIAGGWVYAIEWIEESE